MTGVNESCTEIFFKICGIDFSCLKFSISVMKNQEKTTICFILCPLWNTSEKNYAYFKKIHYKEIINKGGVLERNRVQIANVFHFFA